MTINIQNNKIKSIDFLTVDEGIEFIKKFNQQEDQSQWFKYNPNEPIIRPLKNEGPFTVTDSIPNPSTICNYR